MKFIKVIANPCNSSGDTRGGVAPRTFHLNLNLVGAIDVDTVMLSNTSVIRLGDSYFKDFRLAEKIDPNNL